MGVQTGDFIVRRVVTDGEVNGSNRYWLLFFTGEITKPLAVIPDYALDNILAQVKEQRGEVDGD